MAATVEDEVRHGRREDPFGEEGFEDQDEPSRASRGPSDEERPAFVPLSADVAPQMNLFGEPEPAARPAGRGRRRRRRRTSTSRARRCTRAAPGCAPSARSSSARCGA